MADIKAMFASMSNGSNANGSAAAPNQSGSSAAVSKSKSNKPTTIEQTYQKKSQLEHILLRPDTYIGSVEKVNELMWVYCQEKQMMIQKQIEYVPGLYKIFDEILVNAADNKQRDKNMDCIKIEIKPEENMISIWNNGQGIPVVMHKDENMYVPTMIFGHLLTSSNYNDDEDKVTGGRNGYGAKLCNIFSEKFVVETASKQFKKIFKQTWGNNMTKASEPKIKDFNSEDFTKITFYPDLTKFKMTKLDDDIVELMSRRAYDVAASSQGVKVLLNGHRLPIKNFNNYVELYIKGKEDEMGNSLKVVYERSNERWEVAVTLSDRGFQQMSFVNSIATTKGGRHVDYVVDMIVKQLQEVIKKKNKGGTAIKPFQIKNHMWIFINCLIVNPTFDSQTKENMTLQVKSFGSKCTLSEKFINGVQKSGIIETVLSWAKFKQQNELVKASAGKRTSKLKGVPKLEDANEAGTKNSLKCTLILTEGDSAKSLAVSGLAVIGRDYYGVFPLRGKLLNVREATHKQILENAEINNLVKIVGLQYKKKYLTQDDMKTLRYGKIMIMTDQDQDGSHIKGLLINFVHHNWPELLRQDFLEEFITPIVKAKKKKEELSFYSLPEFEEWKTNTPNHHTYQVKYYKGLGTSTSKEAKEYFSNMARHRIRFRYSGQEDDDHIVLAFSRKHIEARKEWLTNFMQDSKRRKEMGLPEKYLYTKETKFVNYKDFINLELVLFSNADNIRSIPCLVDGLKPGQRKVLFTCMKRNDKREVKVAQLAGSVAEHSAYHHGEVSLCMTIVNLAQNYVGSNNINLLEPRGQFGTRLAGGKDSASPRYIFTKMSPITRMLFHPHDDPLLKHEYDDNQKIEPIWYIPIIPMVLVNGAEGIGTGWMTKIPNYNPREIVQCLRAMLDGDDDIKELHPWYKNFKGTIDYCGESRYCISGEVAVVGNKLEITELPIGTWTQNYKENTLEVMLNGSEKVKAILQDYKEYNTDTTVRFLITPQDGQLQNMEKEGLHKVLKLQTLLSISSMCCFDELGCLKRFESVMEILREFYTLRLKIYVKRKEYLEGALEAEANKLSNQARFIVEKCDGSLTVENKKRQTIVTELIKRGYDPDPLKVWKTTVFKEDDEEIPPPEDEENASQSQDDDETPSSSKKKPINEASDQNFKNYDYLLGMSMWMLTDERKNELLRQRDNKLLELDVLKRKKPSDLWREDLDAFLLKLDEIEEKERKDELGIKNEKKEPGKKKKIHLHETQPSPMAQRIVPIVSDEMKKKIQAAVKSREYKDKKAMKKELTLEEEDEFDTMVRSKKTLKDKLGTPEEVEKKIKKKKGDGLKQTKLIFDKKINGSPKKKAKKNPIFSDSDKGDSGSDDSFQADIKPSSVKERTNTRRAATKVTKYNLSDDEEKSSDDEVLFDNAFVNEQLNTVAIASSDSEDDRSPPPPTHRQSSEDLFDQLIGTKKDEEAEEPVSTSSKRRFSPEPQEVVPPKKTAKVKTDKVKKTKAKKVKEDSSPPAKKKRATGSSSDDEFCIVESSLKSSAIPASKSSRRGKQPVSYHCDDSDSD
ncbi:DNA topoisomerase 2 isoform X2 [Euwallacea fornicatus]|uniref:DNA topoisomerase 2 isoform X2 n=1 Tax=Euwallacea fornicatus TaxID=995702 RepID=UPI00338EA238